MTTTRTSQPSVEPVTLAEARTHLRADSDTSEDAYITALITVARTACETSIGRVLISSTLLLTLDEFTDVVRLPVGPVLSVESIKYDDILAGAEQVANPLTYRVDIPSARVTAVFNTVWPDTRAQTGAVRIAYTAGYATIAANLPAPLKQWVLLAVGDMFERRTRSQQDGFKFPALPQDFADSLLDGYRAWTV